MKGMTDIIELTKLNEKKFLLNNDLIEVIEETPDTIITLINGKKIVVKESSYDIREKIIEFKNLENKIIYK